MSDILKQTIGALKKMKYNQNIISTGFSSLDSLIRGFSYGELIIVGGRPTMGTTQLLINFAINLSKNFPVLYLTFGQSEHILANRIISSLAKIPIDALLSKDLTIQEASTITALENSSALRNIYVNDSFPKSTSSLKLLVQQIKKYKAKVILFDKLQSFEKSHLSELMVELKGIALKYDVIIIVANNLRRSVDLRGGDRRPQLMDLPLNDAVEEIPDKVIFLYRPEYYNISVNEYGESTRNIVELIIAKNKTGCIGEVLLNREKSKTNIIDPNNIESQLYQPYIDADTQSINLTNSLSEN